MIDTPIGPIPTIADLSIMAAKPTYRARRISNKPRGERMERIYSAWIQEIGVACPACGEPMQSHPDQEVRVRAADQITIDHIQARALGGSHATTNQWCICSACNGAKSVIEGEQIRKRRLRQ